MSHMPEPPPLDLNAMAPPPDDFDYGYDPALDMPPFVEPVEPPEMQQSGPDQLSLLPDEPPDVPALDAGWSWSDARLIGIDRGPKAGENRFEVGCIDLYSNPYTGDVGGSYLPLAAFAEELAGEAFYFDLLAQLHAQDVPPYEMPDFAETHALLEGHEWRGAGRLEYEAYDYVRDWENDGRELTDDPPEAALDPLMQQALALGGVAVERGPEPAIGQSALQAFAAIGIEAENFDPAGDPPPFFDAQTGTAYWIGVFQENADDPSHCITSILSLGRNPETGQVEALLAPCVPGDWDKAYSAAEYLIEVAQKGDLERCFDAAEGMALATDQRAYWEAERGLVLDETTTQDISAHTAETWKVAL